MSSLHSAMTDACRVVGVTPPDTFPDAGKWHHADIEGDPHGKGDARIKLFLDGEGGIVHNWKSDEQQVFFANGVEKLTPDQRAIRQQAIAAVRIRADEDMKLERRNAAEKAQAIWKAAAPATEHPYLTAKGIKPHGAKLHGDALVIPMRADGEIQSLQFIGADKRFLTGGRVAACYFSIGNPKGAKSLTICEGFATGATIHEATGHPVAVAFNAGNLLLVAKTMREKFPDLQIIVCADDDWKTPGNPGITKATEAAQAVGAYLAVPTFSGDRRDKDTDFNDMAATHGLDAVKRAIAGAAAPAGDDHPPEAANPLAGDSGGWTEPLQIPDGLLPVEPFHASMLPGALRPWISDIAERMQCPIDFPAVGAMVALSSVIGRKACIYPKRHDDWHVVPNLWGAIVGRPGVMKSPALSEAIKPLDRLAAKANEQFAEEMRSYKVKQRVSELADKADERKAQDLVRKGNFSEAERLIAEGMGDDEESAPALRRYKVTDASVEALGEVLIENPFGTLAYRDELNGLLRSLDREGQEGARAFYLQGYDGNQGYTFDRIMRGKNLHIPAVCISMLGGIQPGKLQAYIRDAVSGGAGDDGLLQRFGLLVWPDIAGEWRNVDRWPDTEAKRNAFALFERLDAMQPATDTETGLPCPVAFRFTPEAQELFDAWRHSLESDLRSGEHHPAMESHLSKYRKLAPALALICALADGETEVSKGALLLALTWVDYLHSHAIRAYAAGTRPSADGAKALLTKIRAGAVSDGFKPADVYLKGWAHLGNPDEAHAAINMLCDLGYLRRVENLPGIRGGRPSITYQINPASMGRA